MFKRLVKACLPIRKIVAWACVATCVLHATGWAKDIYVAQTALGSNTGADATDAYAVGWLNTPANWGAASNQVNPGDTVHLCGTFSTGVVVEASGTAGNVTTLYFEPNANFTSSNWTSAAINVGQHNYITVDGGSNGLIQCTNDGTGLMYTNSSTGVVGNEASYFTVQNLLISNLFVRSRGPDQHSYGLAICDQASIGNMGYSNVVVSNCTIVNARTAIYNDFNSSTGSNMNILIINNNISLCSWGIVYGDRASNSIGGGWSVVGNNVSQMGNWDDTLHDTFHHDGIFCFASNPNSVCYSSTISGNILGPGYGTYSTAGIYISSDQVGPCLINNNLFLVDTNGIPNDGSIYILSNPNYHGVFRIYNNNFVGVGSASGGAAIDWEAQITNANTSTLDIENNLFVHQSHNVVIYFYQNLNLTCDNNVAYNTSTPSQAYGYSMTASMWSDTFAQWQAKGFDVHGNTNNPNLGLDNASLLPGSSAIASGTNLYACFTCDRAGNPRPQAGRGPRAQWNLSRRCCRRATCIYRNKAGRFDGGVFRIAISGNMSSPAGYSSRGAARIVGELRFWPAPLGAITAMSTRMFRR